ncbi:hypothetical protein AX15_002138 [Amanita polypyramis BW_CC]|nr:hypothetical protein AX15_002138 [Amanita polypyramis BW_CC]
MHLLFCFFSYLTIVHAIRLSVVVPLDEQVPPIARIGRPFSWTFSSNTFDSASGPLSYTASNLPPWLAFDSQTRTFHGTPEAKDEGNPRITVTAINGDSSVSSSVELCATPYPAPVLNTPISAQFRSANPSLSSVFTLAPYSGISTGNPTLRVPPRWSFSVGFQGNTFNATNDLFYDVRLSNGSSLPSWLKFDQTEFTLNGVAPHEDLIATPFVVSLQFIASDQRGYSAMSLPFDLVVALHELSLASPSPTMNITMTSPFNISLLSPDQLSGILVDGTPIKPSEIADFDLDVTRHENWLHYDRATRLLYGDLTNKSISLDHSLPAKLITTFNQSVEMNYTVAFVPSCFLMSNLTPLRTKSDVPLSFDLSEDLDKTVPRGSFNLSASFEPMEAGQWLTFDSLSSRLTGTIPGSSRISKCLVTFAAYSETTHSTSHAYLSIIISPSEDSVDGLGRIQHRHKLSAAARAKLILAIWIISGLLGGLCSLGTFLAVMRRCTKVEDTAITGEEGRNAWSARDRKWYGIASPKASPRKPKHGYGWTEYMGADFQNAMGAASTNLKSSNIPGNRPSTYHGSVGLGLRPLTERRIYNPIRNVPSNSGIMKKKEFMSRIKNTIRQVSDKYKRLQSGARNYPVIGKPVPITPPNLDSLPSGSVLPNSHPGSTLTLDSPSSLAGGHSIPRRRSDFGPPAQVHIQDEKLSRQTPSSSSCSLMSGILQTEAGERLRTQAARPRLVPFTSANRVPVPQGQSAQSLAKGSNASTARRVPSQEAKVWGANTEAAKLVKSGSGDELCMGLHYIQTLGDEDVNRSTPSIPTVATTQVRSSFSSLESSHQGHGIGDVRRVLVRMGERFKFRIPIPSQSRGIFYELRLLSGGPLPQFLHHNFNLKDGSIELHGIPNPRDLGIFDIGVYASGGESCVARTIIDVVGRT